MGRMTAHGHRSVLRYLRPESQMAMAMVLPLQRQRRSSTAAARFASSGWDLILCGRGFCADYSRPDLVQKLRREIRSIWPFDGVGVRIDGHCTK